MLAERAPDCVGLKETLSRQLAAAARLEGQLLGTVKSA